MLDSPWSARLSISLLSMLSSSWFGTSVPAPGLALRSLPRCASCLSSFPPGRPLVLNRLTLMATSMRSCGRLSCTSPTPGLALASTCAWHGSGSHQHASSFPASSASWSRRTSSAFIRRQRSARYLATTSVREPSFPIRNGLPHSVCRSTSTALAQLCPLPEIDHLSRRDFHRLLLSGIARQWRNSLRLVPLEHGQSRGAGRPRGGVAPERSVGPPTKEGVEAVLRWEKTEGGKKPIGGCRRQRRNPTQGERAEALSAGWMAVPGRGRSPVGGRSPRRSLQRAGPRKGGGAAKGGIRRGRNEGVGRSWPQ